MRRPREGAELTEVLRELGELVDVLTSVFTAGDAESKLKIKTLQQLIAEVVPLDHAEVIDGFVPYCELHPEREGRDRLELSSSSKIFSCS